MMFFRSNLAPEEYPDERLVDCISGSGINSLLLAGLSGGCRIQYCLPTPDGPYRGFCMDDVDARAYACNNYLRAHGYPVWRTKYDEWVWAVTHHWPQADRLRARRPESYGLRAGEEVDPARFPPPHAAPADLSEQAVRVSLTVDGQYPFGHCFALDSLLVVWDAEAGVFRYPVILDYEVAAGCRKHLDTFGRQLRVHPDLPKLEKIPATHTLRDILRLGDDLGWPNRAGLAARVDLWERTRVENW